MTSDLHDFEDGERLAVTRHVEVDRAILGKHGLRIAAGAMIVAAAAGGVALSASSFLQVKVANQ